MIAATKASIGDNGEQCGSFRFRGGGAGRPVAAGLGCLYRQRWRQELCRRFQIPRHLAEEPATNGETTVLQPASSTGNAWVLTPQTTGGGLVLQSTGSAGATVVTCGSSGTCQ